MKRVAFFVPHIGCPRQCSFCNQNVISGQSKAPTAEEVELTLKQAAEYLKQDCQDTEIAFFGGSFTAVPKELRESILKEAKSACERYGFAGIRFSTRPDCITEKILSELKEYPINRIELGSQSMNDRVLELNNRGHKAEDTQRASSLIKNSGIALTLQMMTGLYGDTPEESIETARKIAELEPDEVRVYPTLVLKGTRLAELYLNGGYITQTLEETIELSSDLLDFFEDRNIKVIRLGLHQEDGLALEVLAGPHHPALRELAEGYGFYKRIVQQLNNTDKKQAVIYTSPKDLSKIKGHGGWVLNKLQAQGFNVEVKVDNNLLKKEIRVI